MIVANLFLYMELLSLNVDKMREKEFFKEPSWGHRSPF